MRPPPKFHPPNFTDDKLNRAFDQVQQSLNPALQRVFKGTSIAGAPTDPVLKALLRALHDAGIIKDDTT